MTLGHPRTGPVGGRRRDGAAGNSTQASLWSTLRPTRLDLKEEPRPTGRRAGRCSREIARTSRRRSIWPGRWPAWTNTPGGGAIIIAASPMTAAESARNSTATGSGTASGRLAEATGSPLPWREHRIVECRLLVLSVAEALEPVEPPGPAAVARREQLRRRRCCDMAGGDAFSASATTGRPSPRGHTLADARPAGPGHRPTLRAGGQGWPPATSCARTTRIS